MLSSPRRPSSTMRIFSSAERCRRVALRISRTVFSALSGMRLLACLIVAPQRGYDEPAILSYAISSFCPTSADGLQVQHLLPTVNHDRLLIKASFDRSLSTAPELLVGTNRVQGQRNTVSGEFWQFDATGLKPATTYQLSLIGARGHALCEPWSLSTFPTPGSMPSHLRLMIYTCGGGHDALNADLPDGKINYLPSALRRRLLQRGLSFEPDALIANGDQIYWDLRAPQASKGSGASPKGIAYAGTFDRAQPVFGTANELAFRRAIRSPDHSAIWCIVS